MTLCKNFGFCFVLTTRQSFNMKPYWENIKKISYMKHLTIILTGIILYQVCFVCQSNFQEGHHLSQHNVLLWSSEDVVLHFIANQISSVDMFSRAAACQVARMDKHFLRRVLLFGSIYLQINMNSKLAELIFDCKD